MKLPSSFLPAGFAQGYEPHEYSTDRLKHVLGWHPPLSLEEAFEATFCDQEGCLTDRAAAKQWNQNSSTRERESPAVSSCVWVRPSRSE